MLQHLVDKNHDPEEHIMAKLMILLMDSKSLIKFHGNLRHNIKERTEIFLENPPMIDLMHYLLKEEKDPSKYQTALEEMNKYRQHFNCGYVATE